MADVDSVLSTKPSLMSGPGELVTNLYYNKQNSQTDMLENTANYSNTIGLSSKSFGSSSQVLIPMDQFISHVVLRLQLPALTATQCLPRGWGYAMLQSLSWIMGASSSTSIVLQGDSILQTILSQADNAELRSEILAIGGEALDGATNAGVIPEAYCLLPLPFSTLCGHGTLPIDTTMLSNNISINIIFNYGSSIYGGSTGSQVTQFEAAELLLHQMKLGDQSASIRRDMIMEPGLVYNYPFIHHQSFISPEFTGKTAANGLCDVQLQSFANADLLGITFWVVKAADKFPAAGIPRNPYVLADISNILVTFNGTTMFRLNGKSHKLTSILSHSTGAASVECDAYDQTQAVDNFAHGAVTCYPIELDFSRIRSTCLSGEKMQNTWRIPNQQLLVQFNTPLDNVPYRLYATYHYNAVCSFSNGISSIIVA